VVPVTQVRELSSGGRKIRGLVLCRQSSLR
jgi:hypothetical protein